MIWTSRNVDLKESKLFLGVTRYLENSLILSF